MQNESIIKLIGRRPVYRVAGVYGTPVFAAEFTPTAPTLPREGYLRGLDTESLGHAGLENLSLGAGESRPTRF